jgi:hypothetical protein
MYVAATVDLTLSDWAVMDNRGPTSFVFTRTACPCILFTFTPPMVKRIAFREKQQQFQRKSCSRKGLIVFRKNMPLKTNFTHFAGPRLWLGA